MTSSADVPSPITPELVVSGAVGISEVVTDGDDVYWAETRPDEGGRAAIMRWRGGDVSEVTDPEVNVRTRVHEYGGGAWWVASGCVAYSDDAVGGELFILDMGSGERRQLTASGHRYADGRFTPDLEWYVAVRERHDQLDVHNEIVRVRTDGSGQEEVLHQGHDFYSSPRLSPDGSVLAAVAWDHPDMQWDRTVLLSGPLDDTGWDADPGPGVEDESLVTPDWSRDGRLWAVTDRDNWWNLVEIDPASGARTRLLGGEFELATPGWVFGLSRWVDTARGIVAATAEPSGDRLLLAGGRVEDRHSTIGSLRSRRDGGVAYAAASFSEEPAVWIHDGDEARQISRSRDLGLGPEWFPAPEVITFDSAGGEAHALFYEPANPDVAPSADPPPLRVMVHGGPTGAARRMLQLGIRYWTSRGVAVVDVDHRGSTLYGREFRNLLRGGWGRVDVDDAVAAARHLADTGRVDRDQMVITGGSAGGLTVLNALIHHDVFTGGICRYAVTDLAALATDTHKFEARYLDRLVGVWPDDADVYRERSPMHHVDRIRVPMLIFQGLEDKVVPPSQSEAIVAALERNGIPVTYRTFENEGHGFRAAETLVAVLEAEAAFMASL